MSEERFAYISAKLDQLELGLEGLRTQTDARLSRLEVVQEMTLDNIKQIAEGHSVTQVMMRRGFADLREHIDQRIAPIEATLREHSAILKKRDLMS